MPAIFNLTIAKRNFGFLSIFGFAMILMNTWQALLGVVAFGLGNGGSAGLIYMFIIVLFLFGIANLCMAEMASMAPTAGRCQTNNLHMAGLTFRRWPVPLDFRV